MGFYMVKHIPLVLFGNLKLYLYLCNMEINDIKKLLYKEKPKAKLIQVTKEVLNYVVHLSNQHVIRILIPLLDIGDANFFPEMEAQLLIRWIVKGGSE